MYVIKCLLFSYNTLISHQPFARYTSMCFELKREAMYKLSYLMSYPKNGIHNLEPDKCSQYSKFHSQFSRYGLDSVIIDTFGNYFLFKGMSIFLFGSFTVICVSDLLINFRL